MAQVLFRAVWLLLRPWVALVVLLVAGGGTALVWLPLFGLPGYELACALAIAVGLLGGAVGIASARQERRMIQGVDPRPKGATRLDGALSASFVALAAAFLVNLLALSAPLIASIVYALSSTGCDPFSKVGFVALLPLPSAALASSAGVLWGFASTRAGRSHLGYLILLLLSVAATVWPLLFGPQVHAFNHFGGYFPGPLYDEALGVSRALVWFRVQTILWALALWLLTALFLDMKEGRLRRPHVRPVTVSLLLLVAAGVAVLEQKAPALGVRATYSMLDEKLGGKRQSSHFELTYPRAKPAREVERLVRDLEFHFSELSTFLGGAPQEQIKVFVHRSAEEKGRLVGASRTQFAKPWRLELHLNDSPFPHPVLRHELAHVMAAPFGSGPFRVTSHYWLIPNAAIIEGLAMATEERVDELSLHQWAAGMRKNKLLPDLRALLSPSGFYRAAPARAYTAAGSFLRYLLDTYGSQKLRELYAHGSFQSVYGKSLDALAQGWESFLDDQPVDEEAVNLAFGRFRRPSLFDRACAREVATLSNQAAQSLQSDPQRAIELYQRCAALQPEEPSFRLAEARARVAAGQQSEAAEALRKLAQEQKDQPSTLVEISMAQADLAYSRDRLEEAQGFLETVLSLHPSAAAERTARVKLAGLTQGPVGKALWAYFEPGHDEVKLLLLREALESERQNPYLNYLLGRRLAQADAPRLALAYLNAALAVELPQSLRKEAVRLTLEAAYLAGDCSQVRQITETLPPLGEELTAAAKLFVRRCAFEELSFGGALVPEGPFR